MKSKFSSGGNPGSSGSRPGELHVGGFPGPLQLSAGSDTLNQVSEYIIYSYLGNCIVGNEPGAVRMLQECSGRGGRCRAAGPGTAGAPGGALRTQPGVGIISAPLQHGRDVWSCSGSFVCEGTLRESAIYFGRTSSFCQKYLLLLRD